MGINELQIRHDQPLWLVKPCNTAGCSAMIRIQLAVASTVHNCKWCQADADYNTDASQVRPHHVDGVYISKDEFGAALFAVIETISTMMGLRWQLDKGGQKTHVKADLATRYRASQTYLANQLPTLTEDEMDQVLARYPDVVTL